MSCTYCNKTLYLDPEDISAYGIGSGRLTLSNLLSLASLSFLKSCPVANLRFIDVSDIPRFDFKALASAVHHSNTLRSLVVKLKAIDCATEYLTTCLCPVKSLERVCLLSKTELQLRTRNVQWKLWQASYHPSCTCTSTVWTRKRAGTPA